MDSSGRKRKLIVITVTEEDTARQDVLDARRCAHDVARVLKKTYDVEIMGLTPGDFDNLPALKKKIRSLSAACIFNIFEGFSDDSTKEALFVKILESLGVPFTGNPLSAVSYCLDKEKTKQILRRAGIAVPEGARVKNIDDVDKNRFNFPVFLKPSQEDASVGIDDSSLVEDYGQLLRVLPGKIKLFPRGVIVEEFISGNEYNAGFLGNGPYELMGISLIDYKKYNKFKPFLTYNAKWDLKSKEFKAIIPSCKERLDKPLRSSIIDISRRAAAALGCRSYFRVDLREKNGRLYVLDVNPNPDINIDSGFIRQAQHKGYVFSRVIHKIVANALAYAKHGGAHDHGRYTRIANNCPGNRCVSPGGARRTARSVGKKHAA